MIKVITGFGLDEIALDPYLAKEEWVGNQKLSNRPPVYRLYFSGNRAIFAEARG